MGDELRRVLINFPCYKLENMPTAIVPLTSVETQREEVGVRRCGLAAALCVALSLSHTH